MSDNTETPTPKPRRAYRSRAAADPAQGDLFAQGAVPADEPRASDDAERPACGFPDDGDAPAPAPADPEDGEAGSDVETWDVTVEDPGVGVDASAAPSASESGPDIPEEDLTPEERLLRAVRGEPEPEPLRSGDATLEPDEAGGSVFVDAGAAPAPDDDAVSTAAAAEFSGEAEAEPGEPEPAPADSAEERCAELESELGRVRRKLEREKQLRAADAARASEREAEWTRRLGDVSRIVQELRAQRETQSRRTMPGWLPLVAALILAVACAGSFFAGRWWGAPERSRIAIPIAVAEPMPGRDAAAAAGSAQRPAVPRQPGSAVAPASGQPAAIAPAAGVSWPTVQAAGAQVRAAASEWTIVFDDGVFSRGIEISGAAKQSLRRIAEQLKPHMDRFLLDVEGHTDASPVARGASYASNRELGMDRARAVVDFLASEGGLPADAVSASSAGDADPPFPNTTPESRRKNRTVVLKLHPHK